MVVYAQKRITDFQISIGHVGFFQALAEEATLAEARKYRLP